jgi:hypothetical protein
VSGCVFELSKLIYITNIFRGFYSLYIVKRRNLDDTSGFRLFTMLKALGHPMLLEYNISGGN